MDASGNYNNVLQPPMMAYPFPMHNQAYLEQPYLNPMPTHFPSPRTLIPAPKAEKRKQEPLTCDACGIEVNSQQMMDAHIRGQKHIKKMKLKTVTTSIETPTIEQDTVPESVVTTTEQDPILSTVNKSTPSIDKSVLQSLNELAKFNKVTSKYDLIKETGPAHCKIFEVQLTLGNEIYHGTGTSIKRAQQVAADQALSNTTLRKPESTPRNSRSVHQPQRPNPPREIPITPTIRPQYVPTSPLIRSKTSSISRDQFFHTKSTELTEDSYITVQLQKLVDDIERALKIVSDKIMEQCKQRNLIVIPRLPDNVKLNNNEQDNEDPTESFRMLKGAMKVSALAMRLYYKYDREYFLVLICANKPTSSLLNEISQELTIGLNAQAIAALQLDSNNEDIKPITYEIETNISETYLTVQCSLLPNYRIKILLTSPVFRTENFLNVDENKSEQIAQLNPDPEDMLNKDKCLEAAAEIRHSNWFTRCMMENPTNTIIIRLLRHLQYQQTPLIHFNFWCLTLLVNKCQTQSIHSAAQLFRLVFAYLSSGVLLDNQFSSAIIDPCEKDLVDAANYLSTKQRLDITNYANYILRLIAFEKYEKIFDEQENKQMKNEI